MVSQIRLDVSLQRLGVWQRRLKVPGIITIAGRSWTGTIAFVVSMCWGNAECPRDFRKGETVTMNPQRRTKAK